jgi:flavin reductase (DIM6/NTAB) family NADH-FMN oxidoreductase RutF
VRSEYSSKKTHTKKKKKITFAGVNPPKNKNMKSQTFNMVAASGADAYRFLSSVVVPRPIALISTVSASGAPNLAPFSFFNAVASRPPIVMVSILHRSTGPDGTPVLKDTAQNILDTGKFVLHGVDAATADAANEAAGEYAPGVSEWPASGLVQAAFEWPPFFEVWIQFFFHSP